MITASICTIGDEILIGQIVDTNSSRVAQALNSIGVKVNNMISIGDNDSEIKTTISKCLSENRIVIITGGLGPTKDDITKKSIAELTGAKRFIHSDIQYEIIKRILTARGVELSDINRNQAMVPDNCIVIPNERGTAPIMEFILPEEKFGDKTLLFSLPGVPFEAEAAIPNIIEAIKREFTLDNIVHRTICTFGIAESTLSKMIENWEDALPENVHLAYLPNPILGVRLRLSIYGTDEAKGIQTIEKEVKKLKSIIGSAIYGEGSTSLQEVTGKMLLLNKKTLATAESCTGGFIASLFTSISGASGYFTGSVVSYDNKIKREVLKVKNETLEKYGAVSKECVEEMAIGVKELMGTDYAVATSGIAGPLGGSQEKPVGTIWMAVASKTAVVSKMMVFKGSRTVNVERFSSNAINLLRLQLEKEL
jgi:nicotinamide-nucleotide amidase